MLQSFSDNPVTDGAVAAKLGRRYRWWFVIALPLWVLVGFFSADLFVTGVVLMLQNTDLPILAVNVTVLNFIIAAAIYTLSLLIVLGLPWVLLKYQTTKKDIGLTRLLTWGDIGLAPVGFIVYLLVSGILVYGATQLFPAFNGSQTQQVGFSHVSQAYQYLLAFATLVVVAPFAEEVLFRGYLYGKLRKAVPLWLAMIVTSALFGAIHGQWNVGVDVFAMSMVACSLREVTGSIWAGVLLHMIKNGLAFYILFINTSFLVQ